MTDLVQKRDLLRASGYTYKFDRELFVNRSSKKAFSLEYVEEHDRLDLQQKIAEANDGRWKFYFNALPSLSVRQELEQLLG